MDESFPRRLELVRTARDIATGCTGCRICVRQCAFLKMNAPPGQIAQALLTGTSRTDPFACSLCGLCGALCPEKLNPMGLFLEMRREAADQGRVDWKRYKAILNYERRGHSALFSWYPSKPSRNVFFPGCTLPGTRPKITWKFFEALRTLHPDMAMVLDCCHKPSHDLGRQTFFIERFQSIRDRLLALGVERVFVTCPNCHKVFKQYGGGLEVVTVYEALVQDRNLCRNQEPARELDRERGRNQDREQDRDQELAPVSPKIAPETTTRITVHDPCPMRDEAGTHDAVRSLLAARGFDLREMKNSRTRALCCGEGGSVGFHNPDLAATWAQKRRAQARGDRIATYCAGCAGFLNRVTPTCHLGDLLFDPEAVLAGQNKPAKPPITYLNRLLLKRRLKRLS
ncbi:MAG: (Fe-S)-binding protein [Desulfovibrionales bacterium]|nr:MAG: (Fe-S)-binding protein [Desulfovibrionales bacterium]